MRKVISLALFGEHYEDYAAYLPTFLLAHLNLFPVSDGWDLCLHVSRNIHTSDDRWGLFIKRAAEGGLLSLVVVDAPVVLTKSMLWRMQPVFVDGNDFVFPRDLDAIPMPRDRACCDQFIEKCEKTKTVVHVIHDSIYHIQILGGLCGFRASALREVTGWGSLEDLYAAANYSDAEWAHKGADQLALNKLFLRATGPRLFEHRFNGWHGGPGVQPARTAGVYACSGVSMPAPDVGIGWRWRDLPTGFTPAPPMGMRLLGPQSEYEQLPNEMLAHRTLPYDSMRKWHAEPNEDVVARADRLGNHLGCAGYDVDAARKFWLEYGDPDITERIRACETP